MLAGVALAAASALAPGCGSAASCGVVGCLDGIDVVLSSIAATYVSDLPITVKACVSGACSSFRLDKTGGAPACTALSGGTATCSIDGMGTLVLSTLALPAGVAGGASVTVDVTVTTSSDTLFHGTQNATVTSTEPNGPGCGTCSSASAAFTPT
jgi:hypothetical protein